MADSIDLKLAFIEQALTKYGADVTSKIKREIQRLKAIDTEDLYKSISFKVTHGGNGHEGRVEIIFKEYGRMVDMGVGKGYKNVKANRRNKYIKRRTPKKIYSPIAYGKINALVKDLQYGFTETVKSELKNQLENSKQ